MSSDEKRTGPRWNWSETPYAPRLAVLDGRKKCTAQIRDMSNAGTCLSWRVMGMLKLVGSNFHIGETSRDVCVKAQVVWSSPDQDWPYSGVRFMELDTKAESLLGRWLLLGTNYLSVVIKDAVQTLEEPGARQKITTWFHRDGREYLSRISRIEEFLNSGKETKNREDMLKAFAGSCDEILHKGETLLRSVSSRRTQKLVKKAFRQILQPWMAGNPIIERCLEKPRGYPGDYAMMEMAYSDEPKPSGGLGGVFDRYFWNQYECVRSRKDVAKERLRKLINERKQSPLRVLSLGGGPCREWWELSQSFSGSNRHRPIHFTCLDQDPEALAFARSRLAQNKLLSPVEYVRESLLDFANSEKWAKREGTYDFVYGMGIANYFYDGTLGEIIRRAFSLLRSGGELIIEHKDRDRFRFVPADWLCDWTFVIRGEREFSNVFSSALGGFGATAQWRIERDKTGELMFGVARRVA